MQGQCVSPGPYVSDFGHKTPDFEHMQPHKHKAMYISAVGQL